MPVARRAARLPARGRRRRHPARRPGRPRAQLVAVAGGAARAEEPASRCSSPAEPARPRFLARLRDLAPDCCPVVAYGALCRSRRSTSPRTAGSTCTSRCCPPGAVPRRCSTRSWPATRSPAPSTFRSRRAWTPVRFRRRHRDGPARPTPAATCSAGSPSPARSCWSPRSTASRTATLEARRSRPRASQPRPRSSPSRTPRSTGPRPPSRVDRLIRACTPAPGAWTTFRGRAAQARRRSVPRRRRAARAGRAARRAERACWSAPGPRRSRSARCRPQGKRPMPPPTGPAGSAGGERSRASPMSARSRREPRPPWQRPPVAPTPDPLAARVRRAARRSATQDAYANLVLPARCCATRELARPRRRVRHRAGLRHAARRGHLRRVLAACIDRPLASVDPPVLDVLRLGAHQLLSMRVPAHAAVGDDGRPRARAGRGAGAAGFVNAVLRKVARRDLDGVDRRVAPAREPTRSAASRRARPPALDRRGVREALGGTARRARARCSPPTTRRRASTLVARPGRADRDGAGGRRGRAGRAVAVRGHADRRRPRRRPGRRARTRRRAGRGQPAGRPRPRRRTGRRRRRRRWLDLCAGPGGKAALLAGLAAHARRGLLAARSARTGPTLVRWSCGRVEPTGARRSPADGRAAGVAARAPSTACSSTPPAPGSVRSGAAPRPGGARRPADLAEPGAAAARAARPRPSTPSGPAAWSPT